jgi:TetR/AcrR family transcriptional regulator, transcriptional repressor of aconitase
MDARRRRILDAARTCFARNGFHATSMQDVLRESGVSAGGVYRHFAGKDDLIGAIAEAAVGDIRRSFEEDADGPLELRETVLRTITAVDERARADDLGRLALQVWAEAARNDELRARIGAAVRDARAALAARIARDHPDVDAEAVAATVTALLPGYVHARVVVGDADPERFVAGLDGLAALFRDPVA